MKRAASSASGTDIGRWGAGGRGGGALWWSREGVGGRRLRLLFFWFLSCCGRGESRALGAGAGPGSGLSGREGGEDGADVVARREGEVEIRH